MLRCMNNDSIQMTHPSSARSVAPRRRWPVDLLAFVWGLAEAVIFFLPVEMLITFLALNNPLRALRAAAFALAGAIAGAAGLYYWGAQDPFSAMNLLAALPGLSPEMMDAAEMALQERGVLAVPAGVFSAATGKAQVVFAQGFDISIVALLAVYAAARAVRLLLAGCVAFCLGAMLQCFLPRRVAVGLWAVAWGLGLWWMFG